MPQQRVFEFFFSVKLFYKSNRKLFSCVCIAWYKHSTGWKNSRQLCKPSTSSRVCILLSRILPTPLVFISGYANTENVFYCLNIVTFRPKNSKWDRNLQFTPLFKADDEYPCHFYIGVQLSGSQTWWRNIFQCIHFGSEAVPISQIVGKSRKKKAREKLAG